MRKYFVHTSFVLLALLSSTVTYAQNLTMHKAFGSTRFEYYKDTSTFSVSPRQVLDIMRDDPLAYAEFKKARSNYSVAGIMGFAGAILIGFPIGTAIAGGEPEWGLAAGGAALIIASIPFTKSFHRHAERAIDTYNRKHTAFRPRAEYFWRGMGTGVVIKF